MICQTGLHTPSGQHLLGIIDHGAEGDTDAPCNGPPMASIAMNIMGGGGGREIWYTDQEVSYGIAGEICYAQSDNLLFGVAHYPANEIAQDAYQAYRNIIRLTRRAGVTQLIRAWNYFPNINGDQADLERYRRFCLGRYEALADAGFSLAEDLPAASAVGSRHGDLWIIFLAGNGAARQVENPLQTSAFRYPPTYGPRSPSFCRAKRFVYGQEDYLFVSGTASIRGHETVYPGDPIGQCATTVDNLRALLAQAGADNPHQLGTEATWKVYIRNTDDFRAIKAFLDQALDPTSHILYLCGDICRKALLVEIEGVIDMRQS